MCLGSESRLLDCTYLTSIGISDCTHYNDAGVACLAAPLSFAMGMIATAGVTLIGAIITACLFIAFVACFWRGRSTRNYRRLQQPVSRSTVAVNCADTSLEMNQVSHHFLLFIITS